MKQALVFCFGFFFALTLSAQNRMAATVSATVQDAAGTRYEVGYDQVTRIIKTLSFAKSMHQRKKFGIVVYENTPVDGHAVWIAVDANPKPSVRKEACLWR
jgi:hypothetical protein